MSEDLTKAEHRWRNRPLFRRTRRRRGRLLLLLMLVFAATVALYWPEIGPWVQTGLGELSAY